MAVEAKRGCGFRKVGGLYLVSGKGGMACCKLPMALHICPTCSQGIKQSRGWTWVDPRVLLAGKCSRMEFRDIDPSPLLCPAANLASMGERAGLLWIGKAFYKTPAEFNAEAAAMGVSRRISAIPHDFVVGKTWVLFAHPEAVAQQRTIEAYHRDGATMWAVKALGEFVLDANDEPELFETMELATHRAGVLDLQKPVYLPGIFRVFMPERIERIVKQSEFDAAKDERNRRAEAAYVEPGVDGPKWEPSDLLVKLDNDTRRGITWIPVPDDDKDHQGSVHDQENGETA